MTSPLLTVPEVARYLGVSTRTVYELLRTQKIRRIKVGGSTRVARTDLIAYCGIDLRVSDDAQHVG
jgi:excisionase family DNA binding protein